MKQKTNFWLKCWDPEQCRPTAPEHQPWMLELRKKAVDEAGDLEKISIKQVKEIIGIAPAEAGMGADGWRVRQWQQLPEEAVGDLTNIL
eukprot:11908712-Heterocapsa_arctica.AAC.1